MNVTEADLRLVVRVTFHDDNRLHARVLALDEGFSLFDVGQALLSTAAHLARTPNGLIPVDERFIQIQADDRIALDPAVPFFLRDLTADTSVVLCHLVGPDANDALSNFFSLRKTMRMRLLAVGLAHVAVRLLARPNELLAPNPQVGHDLWCQVPAGFELGLEPVPIPIITPVPSV